MFTKRWNTDTPENFFKTFDRGKLCQANTNPIHKSIQEAFLCSLLTSSISIHVKYINNLLIEFKKAEITKLSHVDHMAVYVLQIAIQALYWWRPTCCCLCSNLLKKSFKLHKSQLWWIQNILASDDFHSGHAASLLIV